MPPHLKAILSIVVAVVCVALFYYDHQQAAGAVKWVELLLAPLMIIGVWIFPEPSSRDIRKEAAKKRAGKNVPNERDS